MFLTLAIATGGIHFSTAGVLAAIGITSFCLTAAGIVGMGFRVGSNTQALANYRETANSWKEKADALDAKIAECSDLMAEKDAHFSAQMAEKDAQVAELQAKVDLLERMVLSKATIAALFEEHAKLEQKIDKVYAQGSEILDKVGP